MPEITEVEAARKAVEDHCVGKKIVRAVIADDPLVVDGGASPSDFEASLRDKTIVAARRKGKNMWLHLDSPPFPSFQFGMAGAIYIKGVAVTKYKRSEVKETDDWPSKYSKFFVELDDGLELSFTDKRRFARVRLLDDPTSVPPISELGPDALLEPMILDDFFTHLQKKKIGIKALLLDQGFISGIGNWIADEVLYQARIHPLQSASSMSKESCAGLLKCINSVIQYAVQVDDDSSKFPNDWLFNFRWGKRPGKVNGKEIEFIKAGGRTTAYVPELQKLKGAQAEPPAKTAKQSSRRKKQDPEDSDVADISEDDDTKPEPYIKPAVKRPSSRKIENNDDAKGSNINNKKRCVSGGEKSPVKGKLESSSGGGGDEDVELVKKSFTAKAPSKAKSGRSSHPADEDGGDSNGNQKGAMEPSSRSNGGMKRKVK